VTVAFNFEDFGVSIWFDEKGEMKNKPMYQLNDIYTVDKLEESFKFSIDVKLHTFVLFLITSECLELC